MAIVKRNGKMRTLKCKDLLGKYTMYVEILIVYNVCFVIVLEWVMFRYIISIGLLLVLVSCKFHKID